MRPLKQLAKIEFIALFRDDRDFELYMFPELCGHANCFEVLIDEDDFGHLLLNSSPQNPQPPRRESWMLKEVLAQINENPAFLEESTQGRGLSGTTVQHYLDLLRQGSALKKCLIRDKEVWMRGEGNYYIADGMHSLVAYGLWSQLNADDFPIALYLCTNHLF